MTNYKCTECGSKLRGKYGSVEHFEKYHPELLQEMEDEDKQEISDAIDDLTKDGLLNFNPQTGNYSITDKGEEYYRSRIKDGR